MEKFENIDGKSFPVMLFDGQNCFLCQVTYLLGKEKDLILFNASRNLVEGYKTVTFDKIISLPYFLRRGVEDFARVRLTGAIDDKKDLIGNILESRIFFLNEDDNQIHEIIESHDEGKAYQSPNITVEELKNLAVNPQAIDIFLEDNSK